MRALLSDSTLALGSRSTGRGKVVQEPRGRFHVLKWGVFCHAERLRNRPARLKLALSDSACASNPMLILIRLTAQFGVLSHPLSLESPLYACSQLL